MHSFMYLHTPTYTHRDYDSSGERHCDRAEASGERISHDDGHVQYRRNVYNFVLREVQYALIIFRLLMLILIKI